MGGPPPGPSRQFNSGWTWGVGVMRSTLLCISNGRGRTHFGECGVAAWVCDVTECRDRPCTTLRAQLITFWRRREVCWVVRGCAQAGTAPLALHFHDLFSHGWLLRPPCWEIGTAGHRQQRSQISRRGAAQHSHCCLDRPVCWKCFLHHRLVLPLMSCWILLAAVPACVHAPDEVNQMESTSLS